MQLHGYFTEDVDLSHKYKIMGMEIRMALCGHALTAVYGWECGCGIESLDGGI